MFANTESLGLGRGHLKGDQWTIRFLKLTYACISIGVAGGGLRRITNIYIYCKSGIYRVF